MDNKSDNEVTLDSLPNDILHSLYDFLDSPSREALAGTNSRFNQFFSEEKERRFRNFKYEITQFFINNPHLFKEFIKKDFPVLAGSGESMVQKCDINTFDIYNYPLSSGVNSKNEELDFLRTIHGELKQQFELRQASVKKVP